MSEGIRFTQRTAYKNPTQIIETFLKPHIQNNKNVKRLTLKKFLGFSRGRDRDRILVQHFRALRRARTVRSWRFSACTRCLGRWRFHPGFGSTFFQDHGPDSGAICRCSGLGPQKISGPFQRGRLLHGFGRVWRRLRTGAAIRTQSFQDLGHHLFHAVHFLIHFLDFQFYVHLRV